MTGEAEAAEAAVPPSFGITPLPRDHVPSASPQNPLPAKAGAGGRHLAGKEEKRGLPVVTHSKLSHRRMRRARELEEIQRERGWVGGWVGWSGRERQTESECVAVWIRY